MAVMLSGVCGGGAPVFALDVCGLLEFKARNSESDIENSESSSTVTTTLSTEPAVVSNPESHCLYWFSKMYLT